MEPKDISNEAWREYDFGGRVYRINAPQQLFMRGVSTAALRNAAPLCPADLAPAH